MKRLLILLVVLGGFGGIIYWQKEKILEILHPSKIILPVVRQSPVYDLAAALEKNGITVNSPPILVDDKLYASVSGVTVIFGIDKDLATQVRSLQLVLGKIKMEDRKFGEIDLRFSKVVVR
jgi:hypothetical protein